MYGYTTVRCSMCSQERTMYGYLPIAKQIWNQDEGLLCCGIQTNIVKQVEE